MKKILCCLLVLLMLFSVAACAQRNDPGGDDNKPPVVDPGGDSEGFIPRKKQEMPVAKIVDTDNDYGADSGWAGDAYASLDLGSVYLQDVINDTVYDWGHSVIYEDGTYKMWWVRPAIYDSIYYAESKDLKNWTNVQRVICLSPNSTNVKKYDNIKGMIGKPSVLHVDGTYYMYFEAPASEDPDITQTVLEWDNQVLLATSSDGIEWEFYCDENGEPIPVIAMPEELMGNTNDKEYGAGQPSAFYKDGKFYVTYCYVIYSQNIAEIRVASSEDGKTFGDVSTHRKISGGNGYGVTYNTKTEKYMMATPEKIYESDTLDFNSAKSYTYYTYDTSSVQTGFCEFVKNSSGLVDTETFYTIHLQGAKSTTGDWRGEHKTWDGHIHAVNPCEYENRPLTLPNGGKATEKNIQEYRDRTQVYSRPTADAIYAADNAIAIDGEKDEAYTGATKIEVTRPVYEWGSTFTDSWAEIYVAWNEEFLYVYGQVYDKTVDNSYAISSMLDTYMRDSVDVFVDVPNDHTGTEVPYTLDQYIICTGSNNTDFIIKSGGEKSNDITDEFGVVSAPRHRVRKTDYGYSFEFRVEWYEFIADRIEENKCIGMDFQINDCMGGKVGREALQSWSDNTGNAFRYLDVMGDVYLIKAK